MKNKPLKALILAAGFGTRLKPFTNTYPKPLVPFFSLTPLELNLEKIKKQSKIQNVAFNTHYLQNVLSPFVFNLEKNFDGFSFTESFEREEILGTGGVYRPLLNFIGEGDLLVVNGDVVNDFSLESFISFHDESARAASCMVLDHWKKDTNPMVIDKKTKTLVGFGEKLLEKNKDYEPKTYACTQILSRKFFKYLPIDKHIFDLKTVFEAAIKAGEIIYTKEYKGSWYDIGTIKDYVHAHMDLLDNNFIDNAKKICILDGLKRKGLQWDWNPAKHSLIIYKNSDTKLAIKKHLDLTHCVVMHPVIFAEQHVSLKLKNVIIQSNCIITPSHFPAKSLERVILFNSSETLDF